MATEIKSTMMRVKSSTPDVSSKPKIDSLALKKKVISSSKHPPVSKTKSVTTTVTKSEVKSKPITPSSASSKTITTSSKTVTTSSASSKKITKTSTSKVREKKVYSLPGQKHDPPEQKEPLRIFYESLSKQIPTSEMAEFWLMEHGLLSHEKAKKAFERKQRKQKELRTGTPVKISKPPTKTATSQKQQQQQISKNGDIKAKKRIMNESDDDDDDFILSHKRRKW